MPPPPNPREGTPEVRVPRSSPLPPSLSALMPSAPEAPARAGALPPSSRALAIAVAISIAVAAAYFALSSVS